MLRNWFKLEFWAGRAESDEYRPRNWQAREALTCLQTRQGTREPHESAEIRTLLRRLGTIVAETISFVPASVSHSPSIQVSTTDWKARCVFRYVLDHSSTLVKRKSS